MIKIYKNISTIRAKEVSGNKPTHYLKAQTSREDEGVLVASLWAKSGEKDGVKYNFLSGEMSTQYQDRPGYVIVNEQDLNGLITALREYKAKLGEAEDDPTYPKNENTQDIPF